MTRHFKCSITFWLEHLLLKKKRFKNLLFQNFDLKVLSLLSIISFFGKMKNESRILKDTSINISVKSLIIVNEYHHSP